jgi:hypothetical protein
MVIAWVCFYYWCRCTWSSRCKPEDNRLVFVSFFILFYFIYLCFFCTSRGSKVWASSEPGKFQAGSFTDVTDEASFKPVLGNTTTSSRVSTDHATAAVHKVLTVGPAVLIYGHFSLQTYQLLGAEGNVICSVLLALVFALLQFQSSALKIDVAGSAETSYLSRKLHSVIFHKT